MCIRDRRKDNLSPLNNPPQTTVTNTQKVDFFTVNQSSVISTSALTHMSGQYNVTACNFLGCVNSQTKTVIVECKYKLILQENRKQNYAGLDKVNNWIQEIKLNRLVLKFRS